MLSFLGPSHHLQFKSKTFITEISPVIMQNALKLSKDNFLNLFADSHLSSNSHDFSFTSYYLFQMQPNDFSPEGLIVRMIPSLTKFLLGEVFFYPAYVETMLSIMKVMIPCIAVKEICHAF